MDNNVLPAPGTLLDEREAAATLRLGIATLRNWRSLGKGPRYIKIGERCVRYRHADLLAFIESGLVAHAEGGAP